MLCREELEAKTQNDKKNVWTSSTQQEEEKFRRQGSQRADVKGKVLSWLNICVLSLTRVMCFNSLFKGESLGSEEFIASP